MKENGAFGSHGTYLKLDMMLLQSSAHWQSRYIVEVESNDKFSYHNLQTFLGKHIVFYPLPHA